MYNKRAFRSYHCGLPGFFRPCCDTRGNDKGFDELSFSAERRDVVQKGQWTGSFSDGILGLDQKEAPHVFNGG